MATAPIRCGPACITWCSTCSGSSFFLIGVSLLYGLTGTLNMPDLAVRVASAEVADAPLIKAAAYLLLIVFGLKAAVLPLCFWLPRAYAAAPASVAALFAIMTKVGFYCHRPRVHPGVRRTGRAAGQSWS